MQSLQSLFFSSVNWPCFTPGINPAALLKIWFQIPEKIDLLKSLGLRHMQNLQSIKLTFIAIKKNLQAEKTNNLGWAINITVKFFAIINPFGVRSISILWRNASICFCSIFIWDYWVLAKKRVGIGAILLFDRLWSVFSESALELWTDQHNERYLRFHRGDSHETIKWHTPAILIGSKHSDTHRERSAVPVCNHKTYLIAYPRYNPIWSREDFFEHQISSSFSGNQTKGGSPWPGMC